MARSGAKKKEITPGTILNAIRDYLNGETDRDQAEAFLEELREYINNLPFPSPWRGEMAVLYHALANVLRGSNGWAPGRDGWSES